MQGDEKKRRNKKHGAHRPREKAGNCGNSGKNKKKAAANAAVFRIKGMRQDVKVAEE